MKLEVGLADHSPRKPTGCYIGRVLRGLMDDQSRQDFDYAFEHSTNSYKLWKEINDQLRQAGSGIRLSQSMVYRHHKSECGCKEAGLL